MLEGFEGKPQGNSPFGHPILRQTQTNRSPPWRPPGRPPAPTSPWLELVEFPSPGIGPLPLTISVFLVTGKQIGLSPLARPPRWLKGKPMGTKHQRTSRMLRGPGGMCGCWQQETTLCHPKTHFPGKIGAVQSLYGCENSPNDNVGNDLEMPCASLGSGLFFQALAF